MQFAITAAPISGNSVRAEQFTRLIFIRQRTGGNRHPCTVLKLDRIEHRRYAYYYYIPGFWGTICTDDFDFGVDEDDDTESYEDDDDAIEDDDDFDYDDID